MAFTTSFCVVSFVDTNVIVISLVVSVLLLFVIATRPSKLAPTPKLVRYPPPVICPVMFPPPTFDP